MAVTVLKYGVHYKWAKNIPSEVYNQLYLVNDLRNQLVRNWLDYEDEKDKIWSQYPQLATLEEKIKPLEEEVKELNVAYTKLKAKNGGVIPKTEEAKANRALKKEKYDRLKELRALYKEERSKCYQDGADEKMKEAGKVRQQKTKDTYGPMCQERGMYHANHYEVKQHIETAIKKVQKDRKSAATAKPGEASYPQLRFKRFDGTGTLTVGIKGRGGLNKRNREEISLIDGPHRNTFQLPLPDPIAWESMSLGQRRKAGRVIARMRIKAGSPEESVIEIPVQIHRLLPEDAIIKTAKLVVRREGLAKKAHLCVVCEIPDPPAAPKSGAHITITPGFKTDEDKDLRAISFVSDVDFNKIKWLDDPRYATLADCIKLDDNGKTGHVSIPRQWFDILLANNENKSAATLAFDSARDELVQFLVNNGPLPYPGDRRDRNGEIVMLDAKNVAKWKSQERLIALAYNINADSELAPMQERLQTWAGAAKISLRSIAAADRRINNRRNDLQNQFAALVAKEFSSVTITKSEEKETISKLSNNQKLDNETKNHMQRIRSYASPSRFVEQIKKAAERDGLAIIDPEEE